MTYGHMVQIMSVQIFVPHWRVTVSHFGSHSWTSGTVLDGLASGAVRGATRAMVATSSAGMSESFMRFLSSGNDIPEGRENAFFAIAPTGSGPV